jgi:MFS family permease
MGAFGLRRVLAGILLGAAVAASLLGVAAGSWPAAALSALLFGAYVMTISALISVWSSLVFPERPSAGFSAALVSFALGSILAPAAAGFLAGIYGLGAVFVLSGTVALLTLLAGPRKDPHPAEGGAG